MNSAVKFSFLWIAALLLAVSGCKTTPPVNWDTRVGNYTYDQAVIELGPPDKKETLSDGSLVTEWVTRRQGSGFSVGVGSGGFVGNNTVVGGGVSQTVGSYHDKVLKLVFGPDNRLTSWSKNY